MFKNVVLLSLPFDGASVVKEAAARAIVRERREPRNRVRAFTA
jgi:hypothetical protein